jgi:hypothetical protein
MTRPLTQEELETITKKSEEKRLMAEAGLTKKKRKVCLSLFFWFFSSKRKRKFKTKRTDRMRN